MDEKSKIQALGRKQPQLTLSLHIETMAHDYARHGTLRSFAALDNQWRGDQLMKGPSSAAPGLRHINTNASKQLEVHDHY